MAGSHTSKRAGLLPSLDMRFGVTLATVATCLGGCIPEEKDFILIPLVTDASGEATTAAPGSVTARVTITWENGEEAPETLVVVDTRVAVEDDTTQDVLGRVGVERTNDFDGTLEGGETAEVHYEGTQSPPPEVDPAEVCDGRSVHLQVQYSTHGSLLDSPQTGVSNAFVFDCD